ncbi:hypothetical protein TNCV_2792161 [Trichonephila clavipes]|nr:hypothetical protein TNCV_2792161 [Trichonephila clavipes]
MASVIKALDDWPALMVFPDLVDMGKEQWAGRTDGFGGQVPFTAFFHIDSFRVRIDGMGTLRCLCGISLTTNKELRNKLIKFRKEV